MPLTTLPSETIPTNKRDVGRSSEDLEGWRISRRRGYVLFGFYLYTDTKIDANVKEKHSTPIFKAES